jgi:DNA-binding MarR family transcriptional regulator
MNQKVHGDWHNPLPPNHLGVLLHQLADDFQQRTLRKCQQRGHRKFRASHSTIINHLDPIGLSLGDLAARIGISQQAAGKVVRDLERAGYVERELDPRDKRSRIIRLSALGSALQRDIADVLVEVSGEYRAVLGSEPMQLFEQQLQKALSVLATQRL